VKQIIPKYREMGFADKLGSELKTEVEQQLLFDLGFYKVDKRDLKFDWSESYIEGHAAEILDGTVENFSGIAVFGSKDELVADGWMEFIREKDFFLFYWEFLRTWDGLKKIKEKKEVGIPNHIWKRIPDEYKSKYRSKRLKK